MGVERGNRGGRREMDEERLVKSREDRMVRIEDGWRNEVLDWMEGEDEGEVRRSVVRRNGDEIKMGMRVMSEGRKLRMRMNECE